MKKKWKTERYKKFNSKRAKNRLKRHLIHKEKRRIKNRKLHGLNKAEQHDHNFVNEKHSNYVKIAAPINLSFIDNPERVSEFIQKLSKVYDKRKRVFVLLNKVSNVSYGAIVVLLSIMVKFKSSGISFNGNLPKDPASRKIIEQSGFFENLYKSFKKVDQYSIKTRNNKIHTHASNKVDAELGSNIIESATKSIWGTKKRCQGVQRALLELMQNTNNHAVLGSEGEKHWWLSVNHNIAEQKVSFSFVDFGIGVFNSLNNKTEESKFYKWKSKINEIFSSDKNTDLLQIILEGKLHKTVTKKHYRGKGLPGINEVMERNQISNLHIITNDVFANVSQNKFKKITNGFSGTFVYWELTADNEHCDV
ncbi:hypothetical protein QYS49_31800 [Marivirga salinae]|uniref:Uncharacterized protein n=1 Tax=Marivirga salinarum TaxID=3059078 RepID=A0AA51RE76_9BACT|nr:hypothetical protein [Marivirga sp. BDSF4-3]WMN11924.1 hypothetical protein QYS49_31800 [Marivirga sp. BDSF4-3]